MYSSLVKSKSLTVHYTKNMHNYSQYSKILTQRNSHLLQFIKSLVPQTYQFIVTILSLCQLFHYCCAAGLSCCYCTGNEAKSKIVVVCASGFIYLFTYYPARQSFTRVSFTEIGDGHENALRFLYDIISLFLSQNTYCAISFPTTASPCQNALFLFSITNNNSCEWMISGFYCRISIYRALALASFWHTIP